MARWETSGPRRTGAIIPPVLPDPRTARPHRMQRGRPAALRPLTAAVLGVLWMAASLPAQGPDPVTRAGETNAAGRTVEASLADARTRLAALSATPLTNAPPGATAQELALRRTLLDRLVRLYEQQLANGVELQTARARRAEALREAQSWSRFPEPRPYSILFTDRLREELQMERLKVASGERAQTMLTQLVEENRKMLVQAEERIRGFNEQLEGSPDPTVAAGLSWHRDQERLRSQASAAALALLDLERQLHQETAAASRVRVDLLQRQVLIADAGTVFIQADLDQAIAQIERARTLLDLELGEVGTKRAAALQGLETARAELRQMDENAQTPPATRARAAEMTSLRELQREAADAAARLLRLMQEGANMERAMWEQRFAAFGTRSVSTLRESTRRLEDVTRRLELWREHERQQMEVTSSQIQFQQARLNAPVSEPELVPLVRERLAALRETDQYRLRFIRTIERLQRLAARWDESLRAAHGRLPLTGRLQNLFTDTRSFFKKLWSFELFNAEDTITVDGQTITGRRSVTVGKIVTAVGILVVGIWIIGLITRIFHPIIVRRLKIEPNQAGLIRRWLNALLVLCLVLFSLMSVKIPLTVFAFAGGALAIGLGFGMQTMLKNLVSGLILLFERPFRVGDVLDVAGQKGTVTSIGLRASILELWDGTETLIPNSSLIENSVTNWTYTNRKVRFSVNVGVAYRSDPRLVIQVMNEVAERHGLVEKEPKPQVFFTEFGDSTLTFELRFWVDVAKANAAQVSSDLRLMMAAAFAERTIVIDYPQRNIHVHAIHPLPVQVVSAAPERAKADGNPGPADTAGTARVKPQVP